MNQSSHKPAPPAQDRSAQRRALVALRLGLGGLFLWSGVSKALSGFTAAGFLQHATGPFAGWYQQLAGQPLVDFLVTWGEIGIGLALLTGVLVSFASAMGILMMLLFYLAKLPAEPGPINQQIIYALVFYLLWQTGAGRSYSLRPVLTACLSSWTQVRSKQSKSKSETEQSSQTTT